MYTFTCNEDSFTLAEEDIPQNSLLSELVELTQDTTIEIEHLNSGEFTILKEYLVDDTAPTLEQYYIFEYMNIDMKQYQSHYDNAIRIEDDMRKNMYYNGDKYNDMHYMLTPITREIWDSLIIHQYDESDILAPINKLIKQPYDTIIENVQKFNYLFEIEGVFLAGGAIFSMLFGLPIKDLDLFIYGCSEVEALEKIKAISELLNYSIVIRTENAVSFKLDNHIHKDACMTREVQVILRLYKTKSEILHGFDIDSCCFGYDGKDILMTKRAKSFLLSGINRVNFDRLSPSYEFRLAKYLHKGVGIKIPDFNRDNIDTEGIKDMIKYYGMRGDNNGISFYVEKGVLKGLDIILVLNYLLIHDSDITKDYFFSANDDRITSDYGACNVNSYIITTMYELFNDKNFDTSILNDNTKNIIVNKIVGNGVKYRRCIYYIASKDNIDDILEIDVALYDLLTTNYTCNFSRKLQWKVTNPGEQMTGTFHRTVLEDNSIWYGNRCYKM